MANFEVIAWKDGKRTVSYYALRICPGITADIADKFEAAGYTDISVRMI